MVDDRIKREKVSYYLLPNGCVDVFLRKNFDTYENEDGETVHTWDEKIIRVKETVTKEEIEENFEQWWESTKAEEIDLAKRVKELEDVIDILLGGGSHE